MVGANVGKVCRRLAYKAARSNFWPFHRCSFFQSKSMQTARIKVGQVWKSLAKLEVRGNPWTSECLASLGKFGKHHIQRCDKQGCTPRPAPPRPRGKWLPRGAPAPKIFNSAPPRPAPKITPGQESWQTFLHHQKFLGVKNF